MKLIRQVSKYANRLGISWRADAPPMGTTHSPPLPLLGEASREDLLQFVTSICIEGAPKTEMLNYASADFERFVRTVGLLDGLEGRCLELGACPYFTSLLIKKYTQLKLTLANYFDETWGTQASETVRFQDSGAADEELISMNFDHFNIEGASFPYEEDSFDVVIFAEIIEHLQMDPCAVFREIRRVLKSDGHLILTTPNVARLENVAKLMAGANIYDPYSGYGPYGRHNREYNQHELHMLLTHEGFEPEIMYSADVHPHVVESYWNEAELQRLLAFRQDGLGQYLFTRSRVKVGSPDKRPSWLYRSYPDGHLD